ncbi:hypothetical protein [Pseudomonas sp. MF6396]|uniref:hypothetical protein n=1 Tax=Pseudomonas sp. MF6396 TaxID=1960828 RepID=UPI0012901C0C|nr:hypothetical protein [Pseudomonas sp. MF6396]
MVDLLNMGLAIMQQVVQRRLLRRLVQRNCTIVLVIFWFIKNCTGIGFECSGAGLSNKKTRQQSPATGF